MPPMNKRKLWLSNQPHFEDLEEDSDERECSCPPHKRMRTSQTTKESKQDDETKAIEDACQTHKETTGDTSIKPSGRPHLSSGLAKRNVVENYLGEQLTNCQWESPDLVEHAFGDIVSTALSSKILLTFLRHGIVEVSYHPRGALKGNVVPKEQLWIDACIDAETRLLRIYDNGIESINEDYEWKWSDKLASNAEQEAVMFLNTIGALAYIIAQPDLPGYQYRNRFTTLINPNTPFYGEGGQDSRPDLVALPVSAFYSEIPNGRKEEEFKNVVSPLDVIRLFPDTVHSHVPSSSSSSSGSSNTKPPTNTRERLSSIMEKSSEFKFTESISESMDLKAVDILRVCWPEFRITGDVRNENTPDAVGQVAIYMEQQRLAQPHLRFVLGLAVTSDDIMFIRADAIGTEQCELHKNCGSGILEIIRLVLALAVADDEHLGVHPGFEFEEGVDSEREPPHKNNSKAKKPEPKKECARRAAFFTVKDPEVPSKETRYYLDYLAANHDGLVGRLTRVWCAYREVSSTEDVHEDDKKVVVDLLNKGGKAFIGPYALKLQNTDMSSAVITGDIVGQLKRAAKDDPVGAKYLLLPDVIINGDKTLQSVRSLADDEVPDRVKEGLVKRQEIISVSLYKRSLHHYQSFGEVARAVADGYRAIIWMDKHGVVHRDFSDGNLLLAWEGPSVSLPDPRVDIRVGGERETLTFFRRKKVQQDDIYGLVHDFDMAGTIAEPTPSDWSENAHERLAKVHMGTPPFMSIRVLIGRYICHSIIDDAQSLFYLLYLFPFDHGTALPETTYPQQFKFLGLTWPNAIRRWVEGTDPKQLGAMKNGFFAYQDDWLGKKVLEKEESNMLEHWKESSLQGRSWRHLVTELHDNHLWYPPAPRRQRTPSTTQQWLWDDLPDVPAIVIALDKLFANPPDGCDYGVPGRQPDNVRDSS